MNTLKNKKILFLGIGFYDYEDAIIKKIESEGGFVKYYIAIKHNIFYRILWHIPFLEKESLYAFYLTKLTSFVNNDKNKYDYIFIIKGEYLNKSHLELLKKKNKTAVFILYQWDSIVRFPSVKNILPFFDRIFSFDNDDVKEYKFIYRPLFYCPAVKANGNIHKKYEIVFLGIAHSDRVPVLIKIWRCLLNEHYKVYFKILIGIVDFLRLLLTKNIKMSDIPLFTLKKIKYKKYCKILASGKSLLDIHHPLQSGITMRSIEALAAGCFLFTTNENIKKYINIYPQSYMIINRDRPELIVEKIKKLKEIDIKFDDYYFSLDAFIKDIFY